MSYESKKCALTDCQNEAKGNRKFCYPHYMQVTDFVSNALHYVNDELHLVKPLYRYPITFEYNNCVLAWFGFNEMEKTCSITVVNRDSYYFNFVRPFAREPPPEDCDKTDIVPRIELK